MSRAVRSLRTLPAVALVALCASAPLGAQVVRGTVSDAAQRPAPGVVLALLDSGEAIVARALSGPGGDYSVRAPAAGTYRLRVLRVGYRPMTSAPFSLAVGEVREERVVLDGARVELAAVRVEERAVCGERTAGDASVFTAWDQAMTSVAAASLTTAARSLTVTSLALSRTLEPTGRRIRSQVAEVSTDRVAQVWSSLPALALRARGYSEIDEQGVATFYAPGLDVLASAAFLEDHCLRAVRGRDAAEIGVAFEPTPQRRNEPEIAGTLWLSRASSELRRIEFEYLNVPGAPREAVGLAGGTMTFARLPDGAVIISRWEIRMPRFIRVSTQSTRLRTEAILVDGGEIIVARRDADTLYRRAPLAVTGLVRDSTSGRAVPGARVALEGTTIATVTGADGRFTFSDVLPGEYTVAVRTPSLDSIRAASLTELVIAEGMTPPTFRVPTADELSTSFCGRALQGVAGRGRGAVFGSVTDVAGSPFGAGVRVSAEWTDVTLTGGAAARVSNTVRSLSTRTDSTGAYRLCGVPTEALLSLRALPDTGRSAIVTARLGADQRFVSVGITVDRARAAVASFRGMVIADSTRAPIADVEVALPDLDRSTRTDSTGAFRIGEIPPGTHRVVARRIGYGVMETQVTFAPHDEEERRIVFSNVQQLAQVDVVSTILDIEMREFAENQRVGLGRFLTREQLSRFDALPLRNAVIRLPSLETHSSGTRTVPATRRNRVTLQSIMTGQCFPPLYQERGLPCACYSRVYIDGVLQNPGYPTEPFDVNQVMTEGVEAVEWYASPAQTPARYLELNNICGVLVIHRRRDSTKPLSRKERADSIAAAKDSVRRAARDSARVRPPPTP